MFFLSLETSTVAFRSVLDELLCFFFALNLTSFRYFFRNLSFLLSCLLFGENLPRIFPRNRPFSPRICLFKSREISLFYPWIIRSPVYTKLTMIKALLLQHFPPYPVIEWKKPTLTPKHGVLDHYVGMCGTRGYDFFTLFGLKLGINLTIWVWNRVKLCTLTGARVWNWACFSLDATYLTLFGSEIGWGNHLFYFCLKKGKGFKKHATFSKSTSLGLHPGHPVPLSK